VASPHLSVPTTAHSAPVAGNASRALPFIVAMVAVMVLSSCAPEDPMPVPPPTPTATVVSTSDGVVRIGTLLTRGAAAQVAGVELAVRDINRAGGVGGVPVEVFHRTSDPANPDQLDVSFAELVDRDVDVVIGPSTNAERVRLAPLAEAAGVLLLSPTIPRGGEPVGPLFVSVAATLEAQAPELTAGLIDNGTKRVTLIAVTDSVVDNDEMATFATEVPQLATQLRAQLDAAGSRLALSTTFDVSTPDLPRLLAAVAKSRAESIVVAAPRGATSAVAGLVSQLIAAGYPADSVWFTSTVTVSFGDLLPVVALAGAHGVRPSAESNGEFVRLVAQSDPGVRSQEFAGVAFDAVIAAAVAAAVGEDDSGASIATHLRVTAADAIRCESFEECLDIAGQGVPVQYFGVSGAVDIVDDGGRRGTTFAQYSFTTENVPVLRGPAG
jgi:ABC-type branched-subunit amino acid transport system substrate-binding protein